MTRERRRVDRPATAGRLQLATRATSVLALGALGTLGLRDGSLGVAWPSIRTSLHQPLSALGVVLLVATGGYLTACLLFGRLGRRFGHGPLLGLGASAVAASLAGMALAPSWWVLLVAGLGLGIGNGIVDTGVNTHVALRSGIRLMGMVHACYGIGAAGGPLLVAAVLATGTSWRAVYALLAAAEVVMATGVWLTVPAWGRPGPAPAGAARPEGTRRVLLALTLALFFMYTGVEVAVGEWGFTLLTLGRHLSRPAAAAWVSAFWAALTAGRLALGAIGGRVAPERVLAISAAVTVSGTLLIWWSPVTVVGAAGLPVTALGLAAIFPSLVALTPRRLGPQRASSAIGLQLAAAGLGGAVVAAAAGQVVGRAGVTALGPYLTGCGLAVLVLNSAATRRSRRYPRHPAEPGGPGGRAGVHSGGEPAVA